MAEKMIAEDKEKEKQAAGKNRDEAAGKAKRENKQKRQQK